MDEMLTGVEPMQVPAVSHTPEVDAYMAEQLDRVRGELDAAFGRSAGVEAIFGGSLGGGKTATGFYNVASATSNELTLEKLKAMVDVLPKRGQLDRVRSRVEDGLPTGPLRAMAGELRAAGVREVPNAFIWPDDTLLEFRFDGFETTFKVVDRPAGESFANWQARMGVSMFEPKVGEQWHGTVGEIASSARASLFHPPLPASQAVTLTYEGHGRCSISYPGLAEYVPPTSIQWAGAFESSASIPGNDVRTTRLVAYGGRINGESFGHPVPPPEPTPEEIEQAKAEIDAEVQRESIRKCERDPGAAESTEAAGPTVASLSDDDAAALVAMGERQQAEADAQQLRDMKAFQASPRTVLAAATLGDKPMSAKKRAKKLRQAMLRDVLATMKRESTFWEQHPGAAKVAARKAFREATKGQG